MRIKLANAELTGHKRLIDLGLMDGDILVAVNTNLDIQTALAMDKRGVEQHYANQRQNTRKDEEIVTRSI